MNTSCATAAYDLIDLGPGHRACRVTAKLTLEVGVGGRVALVSEDPAPILDEDEVTALGIRPRDRGDAGVVEGVEVLVNAVAHAPGERPTEAMEVSLQIGDAVHAMQVFGDREWIGRGEEAVIGPPRPFLRMPLTWARAFGGTREIWIDAHSPVDVPHPQNPRGLGVDPEAMADALKEQLGAPEGYPRYERRRPLPNLEDPASRITRWSDAPLPWCWSACPPDAAGPVHLPEPEAWEGERSEPLRSPPWAQEIGEQMVRRSHPALSVGSIAPGTPIVLRGVVPDGDQVFWLSFPPVSVALDYCIDGREGSRTCMLRRVLIEPEERRVVLTYEDKFRFEYGFEGERSVRVRVVEGTA